MVRDSDTVAYRVAVTCPKPWDNCRARHLRQGRIGEDAPVASLSKLPNVLSGATWRCVDLHLHTPGVHTFTLPGAVDVHQQGDRERIADQYVERLRAARLDVAAITDYQGVRTDWYSLIRDKADGITVLPGAEHLQQGRGGGTRHPRGYRNTTYRSTAQRSQRH